MNCSCGKKLLWGNKSGKCRPCLNADTTFMDALAESRRRAFRHDPMKGERQRKAVAEANRRPERRERSGEQARVMRIWEKGLPATMADEVRARQGKSNSERRLAHIPLAYRDDYKRLVRKVGAKDAAKLINELAAANVRRAVG